MTIIKILTVFLSLYCSFGHGYLPKKIHSGMIALKGEIPHQVSIRSYGKHQCGGSIIDSLHILTAAHCVVEKNHTLTQGLKVLSRSINSVTEIYGELRDIKYVIPHNRFAYSRYENDIAILVLYEPINLDNYQKTIKLSDESFDMTLKPGDTVTASGWGETEHKKLSELLRKLKTYVISDDECYQLDKRTASRQFICTDALFDHNDCGVSYGDSGGPLVYEGVLVGIAIRSHCDDLPGPDVFTRISSYTQWIHNVLERFPN